MLRSVLIVLVLAGGCRDGAEPAGSAEHHLHLRSPQAADYLAGLTGADEAPEATLRPTTGDDALAALDSAGLRQALVLSIAYRYAAPGTDLPNERDLVESENDYIAEQVARAPDRLIGACSLNPLSSYALAEIRRCAADPRLAALKLHLTNSEVDLRNQTHVRTLVEIFSEASRLGLPVVIHMRTLHDDYGERDAAVFINEVLAVADGLSVQVAHMGGWGGYDDATDAVLGAFATAIEEGRLAHVDLTFDIAAVVFEPAAAGADTALAGLVRRNNERLASRIRQIGIDRVLYATDWPSWPPIQDNATKIARNMELLRSALPLNAEELARLFANRGSALPGAR